MNLANATFTLRSLSLSRSAKNDGRFAQRFILTRGVTLGDQKRRKTKTTCLDATSRFTAFPPSDFIITRIWKDERKKKRDASFS